MKNPYLRILLLSFIVTFQSCKQENVEEISPSKELENSHDVQVMEDYLYFANHHVFEEARALISNGSENQINTWRRSLHGFKSLQDLYLEARNSNSKYLSESETANAGQESQKIDHFSPFVFNHSKSFIFNDDSSAFSMNIYDYNLASLVNKDGIVRVGNNLLQFTHDYLKVIDGTLKEDKEIIIESFESDSSLGLVVNKVEYVNYEDNHVNQKSNVYNYENSCTDYNGPFGSNFKLEGKVKIALINTPIWGSRPCPPENCPKPVSPCPFECSYIKGYTSKTVITAEANSYRKILGIFPIWVDYKQVHLRIRGTYRSSTNVTRSFEVGRDNTSYVGVTVYDSSPIDVISLDFKYDAIPTRNECSIIF